MRTEHTEIERVLQSIAQEAFPDDTGVRWQVRSVVERDAFFCVEAEPIPATVGYPRFRFVLRRAPSGAFVDHGCYCLDRGTWRLLYTTPGTSEQWKALSFDEPV